MIVTRDEILDAVKQMYKQDVVGLCEAFCAGIPWWQSDQAERISLDLCKFLRATGGRGTHYSYFWTLNKEAHNQRLLFLAFMLTWLEDIEDETR